MLDDVLQQDAGVLCLHGRKAIGVRPRFRPVVVRLVGDVLFGGCLGLLQIPEDFGGFVVQGAHQAVVGASAFEPHAVVTDKQHPGQAPHLGERRVGLVAAGAERRDIPVDAVTAQRLARAGQRPSRSKR